MNAAASHLSNGSSGDIVAGSDPGDYVAGVVARSGSSFTLGMRILPPERRRAQFALYAFCREVDDIADGTDDTATRLARLGEWRDEIDRLFAGTPTMPTTRALLEPVRRFAMPRDEFLLVIDGMEMDAREDMHGPDMDRLAAYCRRVAGAVGVLSLHAFGAQGPAAHDFALALGDALQLTNILRDIDEDAERDRLYLPGDLLRRHGIDPARGVAAVLAHPALDAACRELAAVARRHFADADGALARSDRAALRPALLMMGIYEAILDRLERRGWAAPRAPLTMSKVRKLWAAVFQGLWRPARSPAP
jgi:phytoene synthase